MSVADDASLCRALTDSRSIAAPWKSLGEPDLPLKLDQASLFLAMVLPFAPLSLLLNYEKLI